MQQGWLDLTWGILFSGYISFATLDLNSSFYEKNAFKEELVEFILDLKIVMNIIIMLIIILVISSVLIPMIQCLLCFCPHFWSLNAFLGALH
jgi:hypothetical protein